MTPQQFFQQAITAAKAGGHIWPDYAACEMAEESTDRSDPAAWVLSGLAEKANNMFGQKAPDDPPAGWDYPTIDLGTHEVVNGETVWQSHVFWPVFPSWACACRERMALLKRLSAYAPALAASSGEEFVTLVSAVWATDPARASNVLAIRAANLAVIQEVMG